MVMPHTLLGEARLLFKLWVFKSCLHFCKFGHVRLCLFVLKLGSGYFVLVINPRRACAARVTVLGLSVSVSVYDYSGTAGNEAASERYQQLQFFS